MSELINNSKLRQASLKKLIKQIHDGMPLETAKALFKTNFGEISTDEIVALEQNLVDEGMPISEIQGLCDIHAAVFDGSITDIHKRKAVVDIPGHPAKVLKDENDKIQTLIDTEIKPFLNKTDHNAYLMLRVGIERLMQISNHYSRKELLLFPGLEKKGITSIPKVMWGVDDEIRQMLKTIKAQLDDSQSDIKEISVFINQMIVKVEDMIVKENNILLPKLAETLSFYDWILADKGSEELGYFLDAPKASWAENQQKQVSKEKTTHSDDVNFDAGSLTQTELNAMLNTLPLDMTFVDESGNVKYFTQGKERIFNRPITIIGRHVSMCHPPKSVHIVEQIVESFRNGTKDNEDFYINMGKMFVYIRYFAVRDKQGKYLGTLEMTQDIKPIRDLEGEKRLVSE